VPFVEPAVGIAENRHSGYRNSRGRGSRDTSSLEITRLDQGRPSVGDTWRRSRLSGEVPIEGQIGASEFGVSRVLRTRLPEHSEVAKSREAIRTVHLEGTRGSDRSLRERSR
jgi:hypothetical protein